MSTAMTVEETFSVLNRQFGTLSIKSLNELSPLKMILYLPAYGT